MSALGSAGRGGGGAWTVQVDGVAESLRILTKAGANLHGLDTGRVYLANSTLRGRAKTLAEQLARTTIVPLVAAGPAPQSRKMAATVRAKVDRKPVVAIGAVNPKLSGWRRSAGNRRYKGSLAWGIERGPVGPPNRYGIARRESGYILGPNMQLIQSRIAGPYREIVRDALRHAGVGVS